MIQTDLVTGLKACILDGTNQYAKSEFDLV